MWSVFVQEFDRPLIEEILSKFIEGDVGKQDLTKKISDHEQKELVLCS